MESQNQPKPKTQPTNENYSEKKQQKIHVFFQTPHSNENFFGKSQKIIENVKIERFFQTPPTNENFLKKHVF